MKEWKKGDRGFLRMQGERCVVGLEATPGERRVPVEVVYLNRFPQDLFLGLRGLDDGYEYHLPARYVHPEVKDGSPR